MLWLIIILLLLIVVALCAAPENRGRTVGRLALVIFVAWAAMEIGGTWMAIEEEKQARAAQQEAAAKAQAAEQARAAREAAAQNARERELAAKRQASLPKWDRYGRPINR